jgi:hypothetical protein
VHTQANMPRAKLRREPCDCLDCREPAAAAASGSGASAIARQEPPPKSLVICLLGALKTADSLQEADVPHLDALVHGGWAGLLACRAGGLPLPAQLLGVQQAGVAPLQTLPDRCLLVARFVQCFPAPAASCIRPAVRAYSSALVQAHSSRTLAHMCLPPPPLNTCCCRFKQLRAVLLTDSAEAVEAGSLAGCYAVHRLGGGSSNGSNGSAAPPAWQPPAQLAEHICRLLRVQPLPSGAPSAPEEAVVEAAPALATVFAAAAAAAGACQQPAGEQPEEQQQQREEDEEEEGDDVIDMLLLVLDAADATAATNATASAAAGSGDNGMIAGSDSSSISSSSCAALEWADDLLRHLNQAPGFRDTVLLSLVLGPGLQPLAQQPLLVQETPLLRPGRRLDAPAAAAAAAAAAAEPAAAEPAAGGAAAAVAGAAAAGAAAAAAGAADCPAVGRPLQSYQFAGLERVEVDAHRPALVVHRLPGVIRQARSPLRCPIAVSRSPGAPLLAPLQAIPTLLPSAGMCCPGCPQHTPLPPA